MVMRVLFVFVIVGALVATLLWEKKLAHSQDSQARMVQAETRAGGESSRNTAAPVELLVRSALAESSWSRADAAAQWHVLQRRAARAGVPMEQMVRGYVSAWKAGLGERSAWKLHVSESCAEPEQWQRNVEGAWSGYEARCRRLFEDARAFVAGELADPCSADQWGSPHLARDAERAARAMRAGRWILARCSAPTANRYFREVKP